MRVLEYVDLNTSRVKKQFKKIVEAIERDDFRSADVKKLAQGQYYRAKLDDTNRLLLQFVQHQNEVVCLALEVVHQHKYDKSRFLRGAVVDESKIPEINTTELVHEASSVRYLHPKNKYFHVQDKILSLDDMQDGIYRSQPPLIVVGSAGSGKTALILEKLKQTSGTVLYVTHSAFLAHNAQNLYFANHFEKEDQEPAFLSYKAFLETLHVPEGKEVTFALFRQWFLGYAQQYRFTDAHQCFEEFRGVISSRETGVLSEDEYLGLGIKQSIFAPEQRQSIYPLFVKYQQWLSNNKLFDNNITSYDWQQYASGMFDFVVVDEVQDFTSVQLALILKTLKHKGQFLLCGDSNQIVHPNFFSWAAVKSMFWRDDSLAEHHQFSVLKVNFRNSKAVTDVANNLLKIKHARFGSVDKESNFLVDAISSHSGQVQCLADKDTIKRDLNQQTKQSTAFAVLVLRDEDKVKAKTIFQTPLIFSVHEAKGLEYPNIILYNVISDNRAAFKEICEDVDAKDLQVQELQYRRVKDKSDKSLEIYKFYVNALYVAMTRATEQVILIENDQQHVLLQLLGIGAMQESIKLNTKASSHEDWEREAAKLEMQGKQEQADAIRSDILKTKPVPWKVCTREYIDELAAIVFNPKNTSNKTNKTFYEYALINSQFDTIDQMGTKNIFPPAKRIDYPNTNASDDYYPAIQKFVAPYQAKNFKSILWDCDQYGIDFRNTNNSTPLMMAGWAGNTALIQALLERGANPQLRDNFGHTAIMYAFFAAYLDEKYAKNHFAAVFALLAPPYFELQIEGKMVRIEKYMGEYYILLAMLTLSKTLEQHLNYMIPRSWHKGIKAEHISKNVEHIGEEALSAERKKRSYFNHVLARAEVNSSYVPARKLWERTSVGYYRLNPQMKLRVAEDWVDVTKALALRAIKTKRFNRSTFEWEWED